MHAYGHDASPTAPNGFAVDEPVILVVEIYTDGVLNTPSGLYYGSTKGKDYHVYGDPMVHTGFWDAATNPTGSTIRTQITYQSARDLGGPKTFNIDLTKREYIPLNDGWNFASFGVRKVYTINTAYMGNPLMTADGDQDRMAVNYTGGDLGSVLFSISNQYTAVSFYDNTMGDTAYAPGVGGNLPFLSIGYGFWINVKATNTSNPTLVMFGSFVDPNDNDTLLVNSGWTEIGYWGRDVKYTFLSPGLKFSSAQATGIAGYHFVTDITDVFQSIDGLYNMLISFDAMGPNSFYATSPGSSDFEYVGPGYGTVINMSASGNLQWDMP
jgi:hypothetical protein